MAKFPAVPHNFNVTLSDNRTGFELTAEDKRTKQRYGLAVNADVSDKLLRGVLDLATFIRVVSDALEAANDGHPADGETPTIVASFGTKAELTALVTQSLASGTSMPPSSYAVRSSPAAKNDLLLVIQAKLGRYVSRDFPLLLDFVPTNDAMRLEGEGREKEQTNYLLINRVCLSHNSA